jgi:hypothetical protein
MKTYVITEYPELYRKWKVLVKNKKDAWENWLNDKIELIEEDYDEEYRPVEMEELKQ